MDIPLLADRILAEVNRSFRRQIVSIGPEAIAQMVRYAWPGNVRELQNEIQRMVALSDTDAPLPAALLTPRMSEAPKGLNGACHAGSALKDRVEALEREIIEDALKRYAGNISRVADHLGLSRVGLRGKIERYDLRRSARDDE